MQFRWACYCSWLWLSNREIKRILLLHCPWVKDLPFYFFISIIVSNCCPLLMHNSWFDLFFCLWILNNTNISFGYCKVNCFMIFLAHFLRRMVRIRNSSKKSGTSNTPPTSDWDLSGQAKDLPSNPCGVEGHETMWKKFDDGR